MEAPLNLALIGQVVSEKTFENDLQTDDQRTQGHGYTLSSPGEPNGSGELKMSIFCFS